MNTTQIKIKTGKEKRKKIREKQKGESCSDMFVDRKYSNKKI